jgi:hypothetical protein
MRWEMKKVARGFLFLTPHASSLTPSKAIIGWFLWKGVASTPEIKRK